MAPGVAEHFYEQVGTAVDHLRLVAEIGFGVHHAEHLDHAPDAVEAAEFRLHDGEQCETGRAGEAVTLLDVELASDLALRAQAVHRRRPLAGEEEQLPGT